MKIIPIYFNFFYCLNQILLSNIQRNAKHFIVEPLTKTQGFNGSYNLYKSYAALVSDISTRTPRPQ